MIAAGFQARHALIVVAGLVLLAWLRWRRRPLHCRANRCDRTFTRRADRNWHEHHSHLYR